MFNVSALQKLVGNKNPHQILLESTRGLVKKWEPTGLLEGIENDVDGHNMSILLENEALQLINESSRTGSGAEEWTGIALPLVRKIFGEIASKNFVSVQPMTMPAGLVFYLDFKYGSGGQAGFTQNGSVYGTTDTVNTDATGGLYGAGRFSYSINDVKNPAASISSTASATWQDVEFSPSLSASLAGLKTMKFTTSSFTTADLQGVRSFKISSNHTGAVETYYPQYTTTDGIGWVQFVVSGSASGSTHIIAYSKQPTATTRGDFEDTSTSGSSMTLDIPEIDLAVRQEPITAKTRKLKAIFTPEIIQDLNAYQSIDAEAEITSMLSEYISMEIDLEILDMLIQSATTTEYWSALPNKEYNSTTQVFDTVTSHTGTKLEWYQTLISKIQKVSNKIHQKTMRGGANFCVVSPEVATIIESIPGYAADTNGDKMQFAMGVQKAGMINNRFTVYKNPYMLQNVVLVGFRGSSFLETGAAYCPYVPLIMTPLIYDPNNLTPRRGIMTRYAKKMMRPEFYGKVVVAYTDTI